MALLNNKRPNDVLFLMPVRLAGEKIPRGRVGMLYCDAAGRVYTTFISRSVYERARDGAARMERLNKPFATIGLEIGPGRFIPATVEIGAEEVWALERILEHALKSGKIPDILKKYLRTIIELGESRREATISEQKRQRRVPAGMTPRVLDRLPYYPPKDIEISMPIYKAEYGYPLVVLKRLPPDESTPHDSQRLLTLDSDGDMAVTEVPARLARQMDIELAEFDRKSREHTCTLISRDDDDFTLTYMTISQPQRKALETLTRYFEETGGSRRPISTAARTVLIQAKDVVSVPGR
jgi:hypothetical protein